MEMILALAMKFWQWTVLIAVVIIAAIINFTDKRSTTKLKFYYKGMPKLQPVPIPTKGKGLCDGRRGRQGQSSHLNFNRQ